MLDKHQTHYDEEEDHGDDGGDVGHAVEGALDPGVVAGRDDALVNPQPDLEDPVDDEGDGVDGDVPNERDGEPRSRGELVGLGAKPDPTTRFGIMPLIHRELEHNLCHHIDGCVQAAAGQRAGQNPVVRIACTGIREQPEKKHLLVILSNLRVKQIMRTVLAVSRLVVRVREMRMR